MRLLSYAGIGLACVLECATAAYAQSSLSAADCPDIASLESSSATKPVFIVSSREVSCANGKITFTKDRARELKFGEAASVAGKLHLASAAWEDWWGAISTKINASSKRQALIFVHGYNNSASAAIVRAQAILAATEFDGPIIVLIWPSQENLLGYDKDQTNADWTTPYLRWLLEVLEDQASSISIVAHSMGNQIAWRAVRELALEKAPQAAKIDHLVLASADVDRAALSRDLAKDFATVRDVTIYVSSKDDALNTSYLLYHHYRRAGDLGPRSGTETPATFPLDAANTELVDTTYVRHRPLGHADFIETDVGAADLCRVINGLDVSVGRAATSLPHTWQLRRDPITSDRCTPLGSQGAASVPADETSH